MLIALNDELYFPPIARSDGLVAMGGDLRPERLIQAYSEGIFPWYNANSPILWWSPNPRCILPLHDFKLSKRVLRKIKNSSLHCSVNRAFALVIKNCANMPRSGQNGTWLLPEMQEAYIKLHELGFAHSVECWQEKNLVGGVYGVALGKVFFGESMFHHISDASKIALAYLVKNLIEQEFKLFDCQQETKHMLAMGAISIPRAHFQELLHEALQKNTAFTKIK